MERQDNYMKNNELDAKKILSDIDHDNFRGLNKQELRKAYDLELEALVGMAKRVRQKRIEKGATTDICSSGYLPHKDSEDQHIGCDMDCNFCGYPKKIFDMDHVNDGQFIPELNKEAILEDAKKRIRDGATRYKLVSLGCTIRENEYKVALEAIPELFDLGIEKICLSFGIMSERKLDELAGLFGTDRIEINHNLEVGSPEAYQKIIGNHKLVWEGRYKTIKDARQKGFNVCGGGLVGIGETLEDQLDLVGCLKELDVTSAPFNVFVLQDNDRSTIADKIRSGELRRPSAEELLKTLCIWRLGLPNSSLAVNSGYGSTGIGDFGKYSGIVENLEINDKKSLPNHGALSTRDYK